MTNSTRILGLSLVAGALCAVAAILGQMPDLTVPSAGSSPAGAVRAFSLGGGCGTPDISERDLERLEREIWAAVRQRGAAPQGGASLGTVRVAFHCIHDGSEGLLPLQKIQAQVDRLSEAFDNLDFELDSVDFTDNPDWFHMAPNTPEEAAAKSVLGLDSSQYFNIYSAGLENGLGGWATFPWNQAANPVLDGVVILYSTVPDGGLAGYEEGDICVHEAGHWVGLYHTFQGGCSRTNDRVADTPAEATSASGCPSRRNTCPSPGRDPIDNYMDYTNDACRTRFSSGQYARLAEMMQTYRQDVFAD